MGTYNSAYTGEQIDTAVAKMNGFNPSTVTSLQQTVNALTSMITSLMPRVSALEAKTTLTTNSSNSYITLGDLIIQVMTVSLPYNATTLYNFPTAFPNACFWVGVQGGQVDANGGYSAPNSIQALAISKSQFRAYMNSTVNNATMGVKIIAIGY